jgi:Protein of unknown function (DUF1552)
MNHKKILTRRDLIKTFGAGAALLPFVYPRNLSAQSQLPKRVIVYTFPNGIDYDFWKDIQQGPNGIRLLSNDSKHIFDPLKPHLSDISICGGLEFANMRKSTNLGGGHACAPFLLTGEAGVGVSYKIPDNGAFGAGGPSICEFLGQKLAASYNLEYSSIAFQCMPVNDLNGTSVAHIGRTFNNRVNSLTPEMDPVSTFAGMFRGDPRAQVRGSYLLDKMKDEYQRFAKNMGTEYAERSDRLWESVMTTRSRIANLVSTEGIAREPIIVDGKEFNPNDGKPTLDPKFKDLRYNRSVPKIVDLQMDMMIDAMAADRLRYATFQVGSTHGGEIVFLWMPQEYYDLKLTGRFDDAGYKSDFLQAHEIGHHAGRNDTYRRLRQGTVRWFIEQYAKLIAKLKAVPEGNGTMFDNTMVICANQMRIAGGHHTDDLPWLIAGKAGGYLKTGQLLRWTSGKNGESTSQQAILTEACRAMGLNIDWFGDTRFRVGNANALRA